MENDHKVLAKYLTLQELESLRLYWLLHRPTKHKELEQILLAIKGLGGHG